MAGGTGERKREEGRPLPGTGVPRFSGQGV